MNKVRPLLLACLLLVIAACGKSAGEASRWRSLAAEQPFVPAAEAISGWRFDAAGDVSVEDRGGSIWIEASIPAAAWTKTWAADVWGAPRPFASAMRRTERVSGELRHASRELSRFDDALGDSSLESLDVNDYTASSDMVFLRVAKGEEPPAGLRFGVDLPRAVPEANGWRPVVGGHVGEGLAVWPGERRTVRTEIPAGSMLQVYTAVEVLGSDAGASPLALTITLEGREILRWTPEVVDGTAGKWQEVLLPAEGIDAAELVFASVGPPARAAFFAPRIGPAERGRRGDRPWGASRPDVILFLADTFRADNMAAYGGSPDTTPFLNDLADRSLRFDRAWAPAAWTLPSQASMFTGLQPMQHGARSTADGLSPELLTIAEALRDRGYRTVAITDSGYVSRSYGFDQGFELFREHREWDLRETLRAADEILDADDGRPLFLFIQTFRTHVPYRTGAEEDDLEGKQLLLEFAQRIEEFGGDGSLTLREAAPRYLDLYRRGARGLDDVFGPWCTSLEESGYFTHGHLVFTSDHGEEFVEHGQHGHGGEHWEERVQVPLFLHGPQIPARAVSHAATLVDLPRTIAALAGVPPVESWGGIDLRRLSTDRPVRTYSLLPDDVDRLTVLDGTRKIHVTLEAADLEASHVLRAFDLATDPGEQMNLLGEELTWPRLLWQRAQSDVARETVPAATATSVELSDEARQHLKDIGYGDQ